MGYEESGSRLNIEGRDIGGFCRRGKTNDSGEGKAPSGVLHHLGRAV